MSTTSPTHRSSVHAPYGASQVIDPSRRRSRLAAEPAVPTPLMGPANHAPGIPVMGSPSLGGYPDLMGEADAGAHANLMGRSHPEIGTDLFGLSDATFVDSLFTAPSHPSERFGRRTR